jgi:hypothetical protein
MTKKVKFSAVVLMSALMTATACHAQSNASPSQSATVPVPLQGIWALHCAQVAEGNTNAVYFVFGQNDFVLTAFNSPQIYRAVGAVESGQSYAVSLDSTPGGQYPFISIYVINVLGVNQIQLMAIYHADNGKLIQPKDVIWSRCSPSSAFAAGLNQADQSFVPTSVEIAGTYKAFQSMPEINNVNWGDPSLTNNFRDE